jgi:tetratricopeptide (TPR) repeat protein
MKRVRLILILPLLVILAACTRDPKEVAKKYVANGNKYYDKGQFKEASIMYRRALQKNMLYAQAHYRLGLVEMKLSLLGEALRSFRRATDIDDQKKQNPEAKLDATARIDAFAKMGEIDLIGYMSDPITYKSLLLDLKEATDKILKIDPKAYQGLRLSGFLALANKDVPGSIQKFREANQVKPDQADLGAALVRSLYLNKENEEAEATAKGLIAKHKEYGPLYDMLYMQYVIANRVADAEQILKEKAANNPKNGGYLIELSFHLFASNRKDEMNAVLARLTSDPKTFPNGHMMAGDFFYRINDLDRALREYQQGEKSDTKDRPKYVKRQVEILAREGKSGEAAQIIGRLMKDNPKDTETVSMHAALLIQSKDPKQIQRAIDELSPLISTTPANQPAALQVLHFNLARAYMLKGDSASLEQARLQLQETLKIKMGGQEYIPAKLLMTEVLLIRGESAKAVQSADEVIVRMPNNLPAHMLRTLGLVGMGEAAQARKELTTIVQNNPRIGDAIFQLANLDFTEKHFKEAQAGFEALMKLNDPRGFQGLVNCRVRLGDYDGAIQLVKDQLKQTPDRLDYRRVVAEIESEAGRFDQAIADYQTMIQKDPSAYNYTRLGDIQRRAGRIGECIASLQKAKELAPRELLPILQLAMVYDLNGREEEARKGYEEVLKLQPDNPDALNNLAYSKADQGVDLDQALTYAERARMKAPDSLEVADTIGLIYLRKNLIDESVRILSDVVTRAPKNATFHLHYAMALYQKGDKPGARKELDSAQHNGPSDKEKMRIQELRQKLS